MRSLLYKKIRFSGREEISLDKIATFSGGSQPPKSKHIYSFEEGYIRFIQNRDYSSSANITYIPIANSNKICDEYDIMMCKYGVGAGEIHYGLNGAYNVALAKIKPIKSVWKEYLRAFLEDKITIEFVKSNAIASTRDNLNSSILKALKIALPHEDILDKVNKEMTKIYSKELVIRRKIEHLMKYKNILLKKYFY